MRIKDNEDLLILQIEFETYEEKEKGGKASEFQLSYPFPSENYSPEHSVIHNYGVRNHVCRSAVILWTCTQSVA